MPESKAIAWTNTARIEVQSGRVVLPALPNEPGLYRLSFGDGYTLYFGEAGDIQRRVGDYYFYSPSTGIESEYRIHNAILNFRGADVSWVTGEQYAARSSRCVQEYQEIKAAKLANKTVLNGGTLEERIAFHERELTRLREKLALQNNLDGENQ